MQGERSSPHRAEHCIFSPHQLCVEDDINDLYSRKTSSFSLLDWCQQNNFGVPVVHQGQFCLRQGLHSGQFSPQTHHDGRTQHHLDTQSLPQSTCAKINVNSCTGSTVHFGSSQNYIWQLQQNAKSSTRTTTTNKCATFSANCNTKHQENLFLATPVIISTGKKKRNLQ